MQEEGTLALLALLKLGFHLHIALRFDRLLAQTLPYIAIPQLQEIPMALMRRNPNRPSDEVLEQLKQNPAVFQVSIAIMKIKMKFFSLL